MKELKINHLAVVVIIVLGQLIPMGWYTAFADQWMKFNGLTKEQIEQNNSPMPFVASIISSIVFAYVLAWIFTRMRVESAKDGAIAGLAMGFAFTHLPNMVNNFFTQRPYELSWLDGGINMIIFVVAGAILGGWRKYK